MPKRHTPVFIEWAIENVEKNIFSYEEAQEFISSLFGGVRTYRGFDRLYDQVYFRVLPTIRELLVRKVESRLEEHPEMQRYMRRAVRRYLHYIPEKLVEELTDEDVARDLGYKVSTIRYVRWFLRRLGLDW